ncbi:SCF ubiquitin ligase complex subunit [Beauveria asiatica]|uniref:SCF ubiquitin ligase complex subunit n=1 Tax=Beauveria asiatica TaxID=1069075 RepID=A0AAW0S6K3_9HYPO
MVHTRAITRVTPYCPLAIQHQDIQAIDGIENLPNEILVMIFSRLRQRSDLLCVMLVCKRWADNTVSLLWRCRAAYANNRLVWETLTKSRQFFDYCGIVKHVRLESDVTDDQVLPLAIKFEITNLILDDCRLSETGFAALLQNPTSLRTFDLDGDNTGMYIRAITNRCTALQSFKIRYCKASLQCLSTLTKSCKYLKHLRDEDVLAFAESCQDIISFGLYYCEQITSASVAALMSNCNNLRKLVVACKLVDDVAFLGLPDNALKHLHSLTLRGDSLTNAAIFPIIRAAPMLRDLDLSHCSITDAALSAISRLKNLNRLEVWGIPGITATGLKAGLEEWISTTIINMAKQAVFLLLYSKCPNASVGAETNDAEKYSEYASTYYQTAITQYLSGQCFSTNYFHILTTYFYAYQAMRGNKKTAEVHLENFPIDLRRKYRRFLCYYISLLPPEWNCYDFRIEDGSPPVNDH